MRHDCRGLALALLLPTTLLVAACGDSLTEVNENPNAPTDVEARYLLPVAIDSAASEILIYGMDLPVTSLWVQHVARLQYGSTDRYNIDVDFSDGSWEDLWLGALAPTRELIERAATPNQEAVGITLRSWIFQNMTDLWGDIPYSQALKAQAEDGTVTPAYDSQKEVYDGLFRDLQTAVGQMEPGRPGFGPEDLLYQGNMQRWQKFANSLRLRLAIHLSEVDPQRAAAEAAAAVSGGVFTSLADEAKLVYAESAPNQNPYHIGFAERPGDYRVSATVIDTLLALQDPRVAYFADPAESDGAFRGLANGLPDQHDVLYGSVSLFGEWHRRANAPAVFLSYAETLLSQAEAAERGWIAGDPAQFYRQAITAAMQVYGIPQAEIDAYLAQPRVVYKGGAAGMEQIALQKWLALYDQGIEAWTEWRRTGLPRLTPAVANENAGRIPLRLPYPVSEAAVNEPNLNAAIERQGGATINNRLWWDVR